MISQKSLSFVPEQSVFESKVSPPFFYASVIIFGLLFGLLLPAHILQRDTHYSTDNIHMVRHVIIIISYQWLNVETREHLSPVRKCKEQ